MPILNNFVFWLTTIAYLMLILFNLSNTKGTGDQNVGILVMGFNIMVAYVVLSLILTILIAYNGGFYWMLSSRLWRNIGIGVLWLGLTTGTIICTAAKTELTFGDQNSGITRLLSWLIYYGGIWLPLLMLLPYWSIINPDGRLSLSPHLFKILLLSGSAAGFILLAGQQKIRTTLSAKTPDYYSNATIRKMYKDKSLAYSLYYIGDEDPQLHNGALNSIKQQKNYENKFQIIFEGRLVSTIGSIFLFWDIQPVKNPERFVPLINSVLPDISSEISESMESNYKAGFPVDIEKICRVLDQQFNESRHVFRPNMLKIQEVLEKQPIKRANSDHQKYMEKLETYRQAVKNWLEAH